MLPTTPGPAADSEGAVSAAEKPEPTTTTTRLLLGTGVISSLANKIRERLNRYIRYADDAAQGAAIERIVQWDRDWTAALADQSHVAPLLPDLTVSKPYQGSYAIASRNYWK